MVLTARKVTKVIPAQQALTARMVLTARKATLVQQVPTARKATLALMGKASLTGSKVTLAM
jgi:hypothetical protein